MEIDGFSLAALVLGRLRWLNHGDRYVNRARSCAVVPTDLLVGVCGGRCAGDLPNSVSRREPKGGWKLSEPIWKSIQEALDHRRHGTPPNFVFKHRCPDCQGEFLCPDRYTSAECSPARHSRDQGWGDGVSYPCGRCVHRSAPEQAAAWWEAHGIDAEDSVSSG